MEHWFVLGSFFLPEFLSNYINLQQGLVWNTVAMPGQALLDRLQKWVWRTVGPTLAASLVLLGQRGNVTTLSLFCMYHFSKCSSELAKLVPLSCLRGSSTRYSNKLHDFFVTVSRWYKDAYIKSFFPCTARLWNYLAVECFSLTYYLNISNSRI